MPDQAISMPFFGRALRDVGQDIEAPIPCMRAQPWCKNPAAVPAMVRGTTARSYETRYVKAGLVVSNCSEGRPPAAPRPGGSAVGRQMAAGAGVLATKAEKPFSPLHMRQNSLRFRHKCIGSFDTRHYTPRLVAGAKLGKNQAMSCLARRAPEWCDCFWESPGAIRFSPVL